MYCDRLAFFSHGESKSDYFVPRWEIDGETYRGCPSQFAFVCSTYYIRSSTWRPFLPTDFQRALFIYCGILSGIPFFHVLDHSLEYMLINVDSLSIAVVTHQNNNMSVTTSVQPATESLSRHGWVALWLFVHRILW